MTERSILLLNNNFSNYWHLTACSSESIEILPIKFYGDPFMKHLDISYWKCQNLQFKKPDNGGFVNS